MTSIIRVQQVCFSNLLPLIVTFPEVATQGGGRGSVGQLPGSFWGGGHHREAAGLVAGAISGSAELRARDSSRQPVACAEGAGRSGGHPQGRKGPQGPAGTGDMLSNWVLDTILVSLFAAKGPCE